MALMNPPHLLPEPAAPRDLVSIHDLAPAEILSLFNLTTMLKQRPADFRGVLAGKQMVMFFEKPSLRTRLTFEAGMDSLGGSTFFVDQTASRLNARESLYDIAHNLEQAALKDDYFISRKLYPNVDFYSGIIFRALGIPTTMFTVMFAIGRSPGWIANWREGASNPKGRIYRPRQIYVGPVKRDYVPMAKRG